jgi:2-dehydro-3-deoxy-D-gluconate 5-dehydrogenase
VTINSFDLTGKNALVTGSRKGLGAEIALALAKAGANVACNGREEDTNRVSNAIQAIGRNSVYIRGDVADAATCERLVETTIEKFGSIDILINNAGIIRRSPALEYAAEAWGEVLAVNLTSVFQLSQFAARHMVKKQSGKIVNIASVLSFQGGILVPAYAAAKGGVAQLTKALANEWACKGINVNAIAPGYMVTHNTEALRNDPERSRQILGRIPAGRWGEPKDLAGAAVFLCSPASAYIHGHILAVDGGWLSK